VNKAEQAFTLIEVLVALAIFAILALISYRTLTSVLDTRERLQKSSAVLRDQALFFARLENDLNAMLPRASRNGDGLLEPALIVQATSNATDPIIRFSRAGFAANTGNEAAPQRIGYRLNNNQIELLIWDGIDQAPRSTPTAHVALNNVQSFQWRVLVRSEKSANKETNWRLGWLPTIDNEISQLPVALEVTLTPINSAPITRLFALREVRGAR
jgi:general secretion pathway protein J